MSSEEDACDKECPLCVEPLELDDLNFYPCKCEYQICRFCWHRIRTDANGLCPGCRQPYPEDPVNFKPLSAEELQRIKSKKKAKQQQQKQKMSENRKHLANLRVLQDNLVYVIGLSPRIADTETLKKSEYFGKFGKIKKVAVGNAGAGAQQQNASSTAYVTYFRSEDALRAIQNVNNVSVDGKTVRASLGTTKYCSSYLRNQSCHKPDCMYLHELARDEASFTKEDMQLGKHTDYEKKLHDQLLAQMNRHGSSPKDNGMFTGSGEIVNNSECRGDAEDLISSTTAQNRPSRLDHNSSPRQLKPRGSRSLERRPAGANPHTGSTQELGRPLDDLRNLNQYQNPHQAGGLMTQTSVPLDVQGRLNLIAAIQQNSNQSLFSQDDAGLIARAKAAAAASGNPTRPHLHHHNSHSTTNLSSLSSISSGSSTAILQQHQIQQNAGHPPGFGGPPSNNFHPSLGKDLRCVDGRFPSLSSAASESVLTINEPVSTGNGLGPAGSEEVNGHHPASWSSSGLPASLSSGNLNSSSASSGTTGNSQMSYMSGFSSGGETGNQFLDQTSDSGKEPVETGNSFLRLIQFQSAARNAANNNTKQFGAVSGPAADDSAVILSGEPLNMRSATTDWQAAFGVKQPHSSLLGRSNPSPAIASSLDSNYSLSTTPMAPSSYGSTAGGPMVDDDLDFDPFSESSKGLGDLLKEEEMEKAAQKAKQEEEVKKMKEKLEMDKRNLQQQQQFASKSAHHNGQISNGAIGSPGATNPSTVSMSSRIGQNTYSNASLSSSVSPPTGSSAFLAGGQFRPQKSAPSSVPNDGNSLSQMRNSTVSGSSPVSFTTPPPGFPVPFDTKLYQNGPPVPPGSGFNGIRPPPHSLPPHTTHHSQPGPPPPPGHPSFSGFPPGPPPQHLFGGRESSPSGGPPPLGRSVSPHAGGPPPGLGHPSESPFNMSDWQEGLRSLFPNVNVRFSPNLQPKGSHNGGNWGPGGPRHPPPGPPPHHHGPPPFINQPPPPLSVTTNSAMGPPMRPSPPGGDPFCIPPPHFGGPRGPPGSGVLPPPGFSGGPGPWNSLTPPPPGYSPRQQSL